MTPSATNGLQRPPDLMIDKAMTVGPDRIGAVIGRLDDTTLLAASRALAMFLGIA